MKKQNKLRKCIAMWEKTANHSARITLYSDGSGYVEVDHEKEFFFGSLDEFYEETFRRWPIEEK